MGIFLDKKLQKERVKLANSLHGLPVRYVTERKNDNDNVVSHGGHIAVVGEKIIIDGERDTLFENKITETEISMLMSGDGAVIKGINARLDGNVHTYTVHFVYYRK